jgi:hypothetical protein
LQARHHPSRASRELATWSRRISVMPQSCGDEDLVPLDQSIGMGSKNIMGSLA